MTLLRRRLRALALAMAVTVLASAAVSWVAGGRLMRPYPRPIPSPPVGAEAVELQGADGDRVDGWWLVAEAPRASIVLAHGKGGSRLAMTGRAEWLRGEGYASLVIDLPGHGTSEGDRITLGLRESEAIRAAVAHSRERHPDLPVGVIGVSLGGVSALVADPPLEIDALVIESVYATLPEAIGARTDAALGPAGPLAAQALLAQVGLRLGADIDDLSPTAGLQRLGRPALMLIGDVDTQTPVESVRRMHAAAPRGSELVVFEGAGHEDLFHNGRELWTECVGRYLATRLSR